MFIFLFKLSFIKKFSLILTDIFIICLRLGRLDDPFFNLVLSVAESSSMQLNDGVTWCGELLYVLGFF